jgi:hypothetical protein
LPAILKTVLTVAVNVVNFIISRATNSRLFSILYIEMGIKHDKLTIHNEVRWLSRENDLTHLSELLSEAPIFLSDTTSDLSHLFPDQT